MHNPLVESKLGLGFSWVRLSYGWVRSSYGLVMGKFCSHWSSLVCIGLSMVKVGSPEAEWVKDLRASSRESREERERVQNKAYPCQSLAELGLCMGCAMAV